MKNLITSSVPAATQNLRDFGCTKIERAFPKDVIDSVRQSVEEIYAEIGNLPDEIRPSEYDIHRTINQYDFPKEIYNDFGDLISGFVRSVVSESIVENIAKGYLGPLTELIDAVTVLRNHRPNVTNKTFIPWHQDVSFLSTDKIWVTCWIPLTPCGVNAPALDLVPKYTTKRFEAQSAYDPNGHGMGGIQEEQIHSEYGEDAVWTPEMSPGDCLMFDCYCVHRTSMYHQGHENRLSMEVRFRAH